MLILLSYSTLASKNVWTENGVEHCRSNAEKRPLTAKGMCIVIHMDRSINAILILGLLRCLSCEKETDLQFAHSLAVKDYKKQLAYLDHELVSGFLSVSNLTYCL